MLETSARLLRLLSLFQAQRYWSGADLAERLEVTARTLRRDVDKLRSLGYPVNSASGTAGGYQLAAGATLPPLLLDDEEAVAVAVGLRTAASGTVSGIAEASVRALTKMQQVLPERLRRRVTALHASIEPLAYTGPVVDAEVLALIAGACRDCEKLRFRYQARDGAASHREVEPHRLVHLGRRWYLAAWDLERNNWRTFRLDRIQARPAAGQRFTPRAAPDGDFAAYVARSVSTAGYEYQAVVLFHAPAEKLAERLPAAAGKIDAVDEHTCLLRTGGTSLDMVSMYLAWTGLEFEVRDPPELVERLRVLADRFRRAAGGNNFRGNRGLE
ncbi:MAG TPA: YafY family protein [Bryobacteraceae bacterium]|nr:YafY family protein [Bryobacteraceae bacterium]